jgi:hypothetical protein
MFVQCRFIENEQSAVVTTMRGAMVVLHLRLTGQFFQPRLSPSNFDDSCRLRIGRHIRRNTPRNISREMGVQSGQQAIPTHAIIPVTGMLTPMFGE